MNPWEQVLSICSEIESVLEHAAPGCDPARLQQLQQLCGTLTASNDPYISRNASRLESQARLLFGPPKGTTATEAGAANVLREMRHSLLRAIRMQAEVKIKGMA